MKKVFGCVMLLVLSSISVLGKDFEVPHVSVVGTFAVKVTPDQMIWSIKVLNKGLVLEEVAANHSERVEDAIQFLTSNGVVKTSIQTSQMTFSENWEYKNRERVKEGYFASTHIKFTLSEFNKYKTLWMGLAAIDDLSVEGVDYDHSESISFRNEAREKALLAAKDKAVALATTLDSVIGPVLSIEELAGQGSSANTLNGINANINVVSSIAYPSDFTGLELGQISIQASVLAVFSMTTE